MKATTFFLVFGALVIALSPVQAETVVATPGGYPVASGPGAWYGGYWGPYASTPAMGYGIGWAAMIRAIGDTNLSNSAAAVNYGEARRRWIENHKLWVNTYYALRETNRLYREEQYKRARSTPAAYVRYAKAAAPKLLASRELDAVTGAIRWPILLTSHDFDAQRVQLEKLFANRAYHGVLGAEDFLAARQIAGNMLTSIRDRIQEYPAPQYISARKFLESLAYEAGRPTG